MLNHNKIFLVTKDEDESERKSERSEREGYGLSPDTVVQFYMDSEVDSGNGQWESFWFVVTRSCKVRNNVETYDVHV